MPTEPLAAPIDPGFLARFPLFADLTPDECCVLCSGFTVRRLDRGEMLMQQGDPSDGAWILRDGQVEIFSRVPGGGENQLGLMGPGEVIGDLGLLLAAPRAASVRCATPVDALFLDRDWFFAWQAQAHAIAPKLMRALARIIVARERGLRAAIVAAEEIGFAMPAPAAARAALRPCEKAPYDFARFLPKLAFFAPFSGTDRRWMAEHLAVCDLPRGTVLHAVGDAPGDAFIVLRGVAVTSCIRGDRHEPLRVVGPGHLTGVVPRIDGAAHDTTCRLREDSVVMRLDADVFDVWFRGRDRRALDFLHILTLELVADLASSTQALARHINAARVRHGPGVA